MTSQTFDFRRSRSWTASALLVAVCVLLIVMLDRGAIGWAKAYPNAWILPAARMLKSFMTWLQEDATLGFVTIKELTRGLGTLLSWPVVFLEGLLVKGFSFGPNSAPLLQLPPLSWVGISLVPGLVCLRLGSRGLALFSVIAFLYVALIGLWQSTMLTLATIIVAVILGIVIGVLLGVASYRWPLVDRIVMPLLDFMQTIPVFAYLVPALIMFGYGPAAALSVTLIYATPPMARVTKISMSRVAPEIIEFSAMAGCSRTQTIWRVMLPSIKARLMVGVNQVIMLSLNMVIIGSLIGGGGLGYDVWQALKALRIGEGIQAGIAITLLAIVLDRISQAAALRRVVHREQAAGQLERHGLLLSILALLLVTTLLGAMIPAFRQVPGNWMFSTARFWDAGAEWLSIALFDYVDAVKGFLFTWLLRPTRLFAMDLPWLGVVVGVALVGWRVGGPMLALTSAAQVFFIAAVGLWDKAMMTVYLVGVSVILACAVGIPVGILAGRDDRVHKVVTVLIDTLQTLPSFVYLIPVIMLLGVGEFTAIIAVVLYAVVPAIRYTDHGIRSIRADLIEAPAMMGASRMQIIRKVQLPVALPEILLGINQAIMMGLSMLVITALVGTRDLGQETLIALSKVDAGQGLVAGICVALIAITADRLITAAVGRRATTNAQG